MFGCCLLFCRRLSVASMSTSTSILFSYSLSEPDPGSFACGPCSLFCTLLYRVVISDDYRATPYFVYWLTATSDDRWGPLTLPLVVDVGTTVCPLINPRHVCQCDVLRSRRCLGVCVCHHSFCWNIFDDDSSRLDEFPGVVVLNRDMFRSWMKDWVVCKCERALVVAKNDWWAT